MRRFMHRKRGWIREGSVVNRICVHWKNKMWRFSFHFIISRSNYTKIVSIVPAPWVEAARRPTWSGLHGSILLSHGFLGTMISNIFSFLKWFSFQDECFKCGPVYFTPRFRFGYPKLQVSDFNHVDFIVTNLRNLFWVPLNFEFQNFSFQFQFSSTTLIHISHPSLSERLTISGFKSIPALLILFQTDPCPRDASQILRISIFYLFFSFKFQIYAFIDFILCSPTL